MQMDPKMQLGLMMLILVGKCHFALEDDHLCNSPQYAEYGKYATIDCAFPEDFFAVFWYNSEDVSREDPILDYKSFRKSGPGFKSGEYDVHQNGSLIIRNVTITHDGYFSVICLKLPTDDVVPNVVRVIVIVKPLIPHPQIDVCENQRICLASLDDNLDINCSVTNSLPVVDLLWAVRTSDGDKNLTSEMHTLTHTISYTTFATIRQTYIFESGLLSLLVCKAEDPSNVLDQKESLVLLVNRKLKTSEKTFVKYVKQSSKLDLLCGNGAFQFLLWKFKQQSSEVFKNLSFTITIGETFQKTFSNDYDFGTNGSLISSQANIRHYGSYVCLFATNLTEHVETHDVIVYVLPDPEYPAIQGCGHGQFCTIEVETKGSITCLLRGVRPIVDLEFEVSYGSVPGAIIFSEHHLTTARNEDTFDVFLTSYFYGKLGERVIVRCITSGQHNTIFQLTKTFELLFITDVSSNTSTPTGDVTEQTTKHSVWIISVAVLVALLLPILLIIAIYYVKKIQRPKASVTTGVGEEGQELKLMITKFSSNESTDGKALKCTFLNEVTKKYEILFEGIRPIPFVRDEFYSVKDVFVEGVVESWNARQKSWQSEESYHDILKKGNSKLYLIEGDPGCGKSTLTLQLAHDWCTRNSNSPLKDIEIVIFFRLRQLGGIQSIYKAIKEIILPKESIITEMDVEHILGESKSVVFVLDGYDEYPHDENNNISDVLKIIRREMFQSSGVVITTRTSSLPDFLPTRIIKFRLTGFDALSRQRYIKKVLVCEDENAATYIEQRLQENPVIDDLCQIPLFFVIIAHMAHTRDTQWQKLKSVTDIFRYVISCFHAHFKNKYKDDNAHKMMTEENDHHKLDRVAFDSLFAKDRKLLMKKNELIQKIGKNLYQEYVAIGVIVEDEAFRFDSYNEIYKYTSEVRFYHQIFCEWYASEYLSQNVASVESQGFLNSIDPFRFQYVYRFACGKNEMLAEKLLGNFQHEKTYRDFLLLCIIEVAKITEKISDNIQEILSKDIIFHLDDNRLLQRYKVEFLNIAFKHNVSACHVMFYNCISFREHNDGSLTMKSGIALPHNLAIKAMTIYEKGQEIKHQVAKSIFKYACLCKTMTNVSFERCIMPERMQDLTLLDTFLSREAVVTWDPQGKAEFVPHYQLNLSNGHWEDTSDNKKIAHAEYERLTETILGYGKLLKQA
ncbi:NLR family CARD domain-containing protein 4 [Holothuria leucospilota]|uniref:NLR family CARD domain-containing protein 4 n=1 Tax=Holothuria leucospilota TaxID=206669 RepID=A0A9Q1CSF3_HOLLE|nr:NLR family CARD domain-containing protein 4 [Holothuria leucospilota]